jgi:hypothetical protein
MTVDRRQEHLGAGFPALLPRVVVKANIQVAFFFCCFMP